MAKRTLPALHQDIRPDCGNLIFPDGRIVRGIMPYSKQNGFVLEELYDLLQCGTIDTLPLAEIIAPDNDLIMVIDDNGKLCGTALKNDTATWLFTLGRNAKCNDFIVGTVLVCPSSMIK